MISHATIFIISREVIFCLIRFSQPTENTLSVCSHVVAAAQFNGEVKEFMEWYRRRHGNHQPSFTKLAVHLQQAVKVESYLEKELTVHMCQLMKIVFH